MHQKLRLVFWSFRSRSKQNMVSPMATPTFKCSLDIFALSLRKSQSKANVVKNANNKLQKPIKLCTSNAKTHLDKLILVRVALTTKWPS